MTKKVVNIGGASARGKVVRENEDFRVFEDDTIEYTDVGIDYFGPIFGRVGISIASIKTDDAHRAALEMAVSKNVEEYRARKKEKRASLESKMFLAVMENDDNKEALSIQDKINRRDSFSVIDGDKSSSSDGNDQP